LTSPKRHTPRRSSVSVERESTCSGPGR
jgi:hypothetical protein